MTPVLIQFIPTETALPEEIPLMDDPRIFLFVEEGDPYVGYHIKGNLFKDTVGMVHEAEAWVQWEEVPPQRGGQNEQG